MKDRCRNTRLAPSRPLVAWLVCDLGEEPEETTSDLVYAHDESEARRISWDRGEAGRSMKENGYKIEGPEALEVSRYLKADRFAKLPGIEEETGTLRLAGFQWMDESSCSCCGLSSTGEIKGPWAVCPSCDQCGECGHFDDCPMPHVHFEGKPAYTLCGQLVEVSYSRLATDDKPGQVTCVDCADRLERKGA